MSAWLPRPASVPIRPPTSRPPTTVLRQRNVPEAILSLSTLAKPDYVDLFTVTTSAAADRSPEQWARAAIEDAAGLAGQFIWPPLSIGHRQATNAAKARAFDYAESEVVHRRRRRRLE